MSHGHVTPNKDGSKARCGGPMICTVCSKEFSAQYGSDLKNWEPVRDEQSGQIIGWSRKERHSRVV